MKKFKVTLSGNVYYAEVEKVSNALYKVKVDDKVVEVEVEEEVIKSVKGVPSYRPESVDLGQKVVKAMLPGTIIKILVSPGDEVKAGETLLILEAMKMENEIVSPSSGKVKEVRVSEGQRVETGDVLVVLE
ncbi:biotin carboxyl carrier protein [Geoglobus ahangari]|uniref:Biotin carboxyl carrier protein n=1 Tax=Geoglobus ahangari TaxID=113653 RepID=A0A0F7II97_9EURY|nr:biotin/lipoyl-containing protein [Geoglobus ahangari]AKG92549.1 biotin carboxyl carrier protein [Geoglobus ahangari]